MKDLSQGSISRHLLTMSAPIMIGMLVQTLYVLVDLYFVGRLGDAALAGVSAASTVMFMVMALTQMLSVGTMAIMAQAVGRKDKTEANLAFNQSLLLALAGAVLTLLAVYMAGPAYFGALGADAPTQAAGLAYLYAYAPGLALQFIGNAMATGLRATGIVKPAMLVQLLGVLLNAVLAPILIAGWGTGLALGVAGAGLASTVSVLVGTVLLAVYFFKAEKYVGFDRALLRPLWPMLKRLLAIGFPAGAEFACLFLFMAVIYHCVSPFGAYAMAGFGLGSRVMQAVFLPGMAISFAIPPIAGQNLGAGHLDRVRATIRQAIIIESVLMLGLTLLCQLLPQALVRPFSSEPAVLSVAVEFLQLISFNFVATGIVFACSGLFQALGNSWPGLFSTASRLLTFALPALWLSGQPGFTLHQLWLLSVATVAVQALTSLLLLRWQLRKLAPLPPTTITAAPAIEPA